MIRDKSPNNNMEHLTNKKEQIGTEGLTGKERMEILLGIFGTDEARRRFLDMGREYLKERRYAPSSPDSENYRPNMTAYAQPRRAYFHNDIMNTIQQLAVQSKNLNTLQLAVLSELRSREEVARCLREYIAAERGDEDDEEELNKPPSTPPSGTSGVAFWHSRGREH